MVEPIVYAGSLRDLIRKRVCKDMLSPPEATSKRKVFIVDNDTKTIVSSLFRLSDLMENGVTLMQRLDKGREPMPKMDAVYFIAPSTESLAALAGDWASGRPYKSAHIFFSRPISDDDMDELMSGQLPKYAKSFAESNLDFFVPEPLVFHFNDPRPTSIFDPSSRGEVQARHAARRLAGLCANLGGVPQVRASTAAVARRVADELAAELERRHAALPALPTTLLVLDRSVDPIAPLLHETTYQAMLYDLLGCEANSPLRGAVYTQQRESASARGKDKDKKKEKEKEKDKDKEREEEEEDGAQTNQVEHILDEEDAHWVRLRHEQLPAVRKYLAASLARVEETNKMAKVKRKDASDVSVHELSHAMKELPALRAFMNKHSLHADISRNLMSQCEARGLDRLLPVELSLATGVDADGATFSKPLTACRPVLKDVTISASDKLRVVALCRSSPIRVSESDLSTLLEAAEMDDQDLAKINKMQEMDLLGSATDGKKKGKKGKGNEKRKKNSEDGDDSDKGAQRAYAPEVSGIVERLITGELSVTEFPVVREGGSGAGKKKKKKGKDGDEQKTRKSGKRIDAHEWKTDQGKAKEGEIDWTEDMPLIVYVAGGVTYSEIRSVYEIAEMYSKNIAIGGDNILLPDSYLDSFANF